MALIITLGNLVAFTRLMQFNQTNGKERTLAHVELVEAALQDLFDAVHLDFHTFFLKPHTSFR
jgi:hypothetical protein